MRLHEDIRPYRTVTKTRLHEHEQKHGKQLLYRSAAITYPNEANNISRGTDADYRLNDQWMIQPRSTVTLLFFESSVFAMKLSIISYFAVQIMRATDGMEKYKRYMYITLKFGIPSFQFFYIYQLYRFVQWCELILFSILDSGIDWILNL